jgi:hypothetical protein
MILFPPGEGDQLALIDGSVHVNYRSQGLGTYLLEWLEARARQEFADAKNESPKLLRTSCAGHQADRIALFEQNGFQAKRYSFQMRRSLVEPVQEMSLPAGLKWVKWAPELDFPLMHAFNSAFSEQWGLQTMNEAVARVRSGVPQFRGDLSYLAMQGDSIAGFCINWVERRKAQKAGLRLSE